MLNLNYNIQLKDIFIYKLTEYNVSKPVEIYLSEDINEKHLIFNSLDRPYGGENKHYFFYSPYYGYCYDLFAQLLSGLHTFGDRAALLEEYGSKILERLYLHYQNSNIAYNTIEQFLVDFKYKIAETLPPLLLKQYYMFEKIYALTDDDITEREHAININALNDNSKIEKPLDNLAEFVSEQNASKISKNKLNAYVDYLEEVKPTVERELIKAVKPLFFTVIPEYNYIYKGEY